jgi:class 3 adenylate cyclase
MTHAHFPSVVIYDTYLFPSNYLEAISDIIIQSNGTVDKYIGEGIMAFWNAPYSLKEHAAVGCNVALQSQQRLRDLQEGKNNDSSSFPFSLNDRAVSCYL